MENLTGHAMLLPIDNIDTDRIIPARFLITTKIEGLGRHFFNDWVHGRSSGKNAKILVAGHNFGCGSSREHAVVALKALGASCLVAGSFARIFFRNCINLGLLPLECPSAVAGIDPGDEVSVDPATGKIENVTRGVVFDFKPLPSFLEEILAAGDMTSYVRDRLSQARRQ